MSHHDHLLKQLCGSSRETFEKARELLYIATAKTAPGTGFQLKDPLGLPAACALIASEQLQNTVVDPTSAQGNSCLNPAAFRRCLAEVKAALSHDASNQPTTHVERRQTRSEFISRVSYDTLIAKYALSQEYGDRFISWCQRAEFAYFDLGKGNNMHRDSLKIKHGIFFWVCEILEPGRLDLASFVKDNGAHSDNTRSISKVMEVYGIKTRALIIEESKRPKDAVTSRIPTRISPAKRPKREAPTKDSPKKRKLSSEDRAQEISTQKQSNIANVRQASGPPMGLFPPSTSPRKSSSKPAPQKRDSLRKAKITVVAQEDSDLEMSPPDTPSKTRLRANSNGLSISPDRRLTLSPSPIRRSGRLKSTDISPVKSIIDAEAIYIDHSIDHVNRLTTSVRKRFRPVFLDQKQWNTLDPLLAKLQEKMEKAAITLST